MRRVIPAATFILALAFGQSVLVACGDKFFLVGNGTKYSQAYASLNPGSVLVYTGGTTEISKGLRNARLHKYIKDAGHRLILAANRAELQEALQSGQVDVIVGGMGQADGLLDEAGAAASKPVVLPIQGDGADASSSRPFAAKLKSSDKVNKFLSGIDNVMKSRKAAARTNRG